MSGTARKASRARRTAEPRPPVPGDRAPLRLCVTRGGLGIELAASAAERPTLGPVEVDELAVALSGMAFPVDLSGGVPRFRHRRGQLERLVLLARPDRVAAALAPRLRGVLGSSATPALTVAASAHGLTLGLCDGERALAFELVFAPREGDARWIVASARAEGLATPALGAALRAIDALAGRFGERRGATLTIASVASLVAREVLPPLGARVPSTEGVRLGLLETTREGSRLAADRAFAPAKLEPEVVRAIELAALASDGDDALAGARLDEARARYLVALERAPRHPDLVRRVVELDAHVPGRAEAALAMLVELAPAIDGGGPAAKLLAASGDAKGAGAALEREAERETYGPLAALTWLEAAKLAPDAATRSLRLERAIARAPGLAAPRWSRIEARVRVADVASAVADVEHLEAAATGAAARHAVLVRAAELMLAHGHPAQATTIFERALRYAPDAPRALSGLGRTLLSAGRSGRALDLLSRAVGLADERGEKLYDVTLVLARALAEVAGDAPAAIARLRQIPPGERESLDARALEGALRARLGDVAGASLAYAALCDLVELAPPDDAAKAAALLEGAAAFERDVRGDRASAERLLAVALRLCPRDARLARAFRDVAAGAGAPPAPPAELAASPPAASTAIDDADEAELGRRADALADRLRATPTDGALVLELADVLERLGRDLELSALLAARLAEPPDASHAEIVARQRVTYARLAAAARAAGRDDEALLYDDLATTL